MTPEAEEARDRLLFHLENQEGFWFALVVGDDPRPRAQLRETAEAWCREHGREFHLHAPDVHQLAGLAAELSRGAPPGVHWIRTDGLGALIEQWDAAASQLVMAMNERREAYRRRLDGAVILEGRESLKRLTRELAPDMFSIRAFIAEPGVHSGPTMDVASIWRDPTDSIQALLSHAASDPDREVERASRLSTIDNQGAFEAWTRSMAAAASGFLMSGRAEEARRCAESLVDRAELSPAQGHIGGTARDAYRHGLAVRCIALSALGRRYDALRAIEQAIVVFEREFEAASDPVEAGALWLYLNDIYATHGRLLLHLGHLDSAKEALQNRLDVARMIVQHAPAVAEWRIELLNARRELAHALVQCGDMVNAELALRAAVDAAGEHVQRSGDPRWQLELSKSYSSLGSVLNARGDLAGAVEALQSARSAAERLGEQDTDVRVQALLVRSLLALAEAHYMLGDFGASREVLDDCFSVLRRKSSQSAFDAWTVAGAHLMRAAVSLVLGKIHGAESDLLACWLAVRSLPVGVEEVPLANAMTRLHLDIVSRLGWKTGSGVSGVNRSLGRHLVGYFKRAAALGERVRQTAPHDPLACVLLNASYLALARLLRLQGRDRASRRIRHKRRVLRRSRTTRRPPLAKP